MTSSRRVVTALGVLLGLAVFVPAASADISPTLKLDQSAGTQAGSSVALGTDITFAPSNPTTDSVKDLTEVLPPGLLADASINGGVCIKTAPPSSGLPPAACQIGTGQATIVANGALTETATLALYLVAPPQPSDLAGIVIYQHIGTGPTSMFGSPGHVVVRPSSDPAGVGIDISFTDIPQSVSFGGGAIPISLKELQTTITSIRMPTSCPSTPANYTVNADSYSDSTTKTTSDPLNVTGCSSLTITPTFTVTAVRDTGDPGVQVTTDLQQPGTSDQATSSQVVLSLPPNVIGPNVAAVVGGGILCSDPTFASCKTIGTASSTSPLYPIALTGNAYLTGSLAAPQIALVFPPPFPITLTGAADITKGTTTFTGVPDLPLTDLQVDLTGGPNSVFTPSCNPASGTASAALTTQDGDLTMTASSPFTVSNCPPPTGPTGSGGSPTTIPTVTPPKPPPPVHAGRPRLRSLSLHRVSRRRLVLGLTVLAGTHAPGLKSVTIALPARLRFAVKHGHRLRLRGRISVRGAGIASVSRAHHRLYIKLRRPARRVTVSIRSLTVPGLGAAAKHRHRVRLRVQVSVRAANGRLTRFRAKRLSVRVADLARRGPVKVKHDGRRQEVGSGA